VFERFTDRARRVVVFAQDEARMLGHNHIGTEHLLLGTLREGDGKGAKALEALDVSLEAARRLVEEMVGRGQAAPVGHIPFTPRAKKVLENSLRESIALKHHHIGSEHILLGIIDSGGVASRVLETIGVSSTQIRDAVAHVLAGGSDVESDQGSTEADVEEDSMEPRCPSCSEMLAETVEYHVLEVPSGSSGGPSITMRFLSCRACGHTLGIAPPVKAQAPMGWGRLPSWLRPWM
jgi:ATP-dependent Clp protease ATP-binding subunit ClpC